MVITVKISDRGETRTVTRSRAPVVGGYVKYQGRRCLVLAVTYPVKHWMAAA
jgi:hypothetical protein